MVQVCIQSVTLIPCRNRLIVIVKIRPLPINFFLLLFLILCANAQFLILIIYKVINKIGFQ